MVSSLNLKEYFYKQSTICYTYVYMKYGNFLIAMGIITIITTFSGIPTGWKKVIILITSLLVMIIGWIIYTVAKSRAKRRAEKVQAFEQTITPESYEEMAEEIAEDVAEQVEEEIDRM